MDRPPDLRLFSLLGVMLLAGCGPSPRWPAHEAAAAAFPNPGAVEFRNVRQVSPGACGEVNGRLLSGEMSGFRRFYYSESTGAVIEGMDAGTGSNIGSFEAAQLNDGLISMMCDE